MPTMDEQLKHLNILADFENLSTGVNNQVSTVKAKMDNLVAFSVDPILSNPERNEVVAEIAVLKQALLDMINSYQG